MFSQIAVKTHLRIDCIQPRDGLATLGHGPMLLGTRFLSTPSHSFLIVLATQSPGGWVGNTAVLSPRIFNLCSNVCLINWNSFFSDIWAWGVAVGNTALIVGRVGSNPRLRIRSLFSLRFREKQTRFLIYWKILNLIIEITSVEAWARLPWWLVQVPWLDSHRFDSGYGNPRLFCKNALCLAFLKCSNPNLIIYRSSQKFCIVLGKWVKVQE